jgi:outer membrane receptor protein involved in Fe transport
MGEWKDGTSATANPLSSYLRTDISLSYHIRETTSAYFWVRNLFDRNLRNPSLWDSEIGVPEAGRIVGIGLSYKF